MMDQIYIDCDGVLTDGRLHVDHTGYKMFKSFHTRDVRAIRELIYTGREVTIVSADDWNGIENFAEKVGASFLCIRDKSSIVARSKNYIAIGDDAWDVPMLEGAAIAFCPSDADASVKSIHGIIISDVKGGCGVIASILPEILIADRIPDEMEME